MKGHAEDAIAEPAELGRIARHELDDRVVTDLKGAAPVAPGGRNLDAAHEALIGLGRRGNVAHGRHDGHLAREAERMLIRSEEHTSELQSLMRISYAVFCLKKKTSP